MAKGQFWKKVGAGIKAGVGLLANAAKTVISGAFDTGVAAGSTVVNVPGGDPTASFTNKQERKAEKTAGEVKNWLMVNWYWIAAPIGLGLIIWLIVRGGNKKKKVGSSTRRRSTAKKTSSATSTRKKSGGATWRTKPRSQWTAADKSAWSKWMRSQRKKK